MAWSDIAPRIVDQVFGRQTYNQIVSNINALRTLIAAEHYIDGRHAPATMETLGAVAFGQYRSSTGGLDTGSFNLAAADAGKSEGRVTFEFLQEIPATCVPFSSHNADFVAAGTSNYRTLIVDRTTKSVTVECLDSSDNLIAPVAIGLVVQSWPIAFPSVTAQTSYLPAPQASVDKIFGYQMANVLTNSIDRLTDIFGHGHNTSTGAHVPEKMRQMGARATATATAGAGGTSLTLNNARGITAAAYVGTGWYRFTISPALTPPFAALAGVDTPNINRRAEIYDQAGPTPASTVDVAVYNNAGTLTNLTAGDMISVAVYQR